MPGRRKTPRERLRDQLEESARDLADLPDWIRETPPDFGDARRGDDGADDDG